MKIIAAILALTIATPAAAWPDERDFQRHDVSAQHPAARVKAWKRVYKPIPKTVVKTVVTVEGLEAPGFCRPAISVVGDEAKSKDAAELQARQHWMKQARFHYGEKFIEIGNARDVFFQCSRSDFPVTGGKFGATLDAVVHNWRCNVRATPCVQPMARGDDGK